MPLTPATFYQGSDFTLEHNLNDGSGTPIDLTATAVQRMDLTLEVDGQEVARFSTDATAQLGEAQALAFPTSPVNRLTVQLRAADTGRYPAGRLRGWLRTEAVGTGVVALHELQLGIVRSARTNVKS